MTDPLPRLFDTDATIRQIGEGLLARTLPRVEWTHEAHLAATLWLLRERPDIDVDVAIAGIISGYNQSVGGTNDATQGYHETITRCFVAGVRLHMAGRPPGDTLMDAVNALLTTPMGRRDWPLNFYGHDRLFSVAARLGFVEPDLAPLPVM